MSTITNATATAITTTAPTTKPRYGRLLKLAAFLDKLPTKKFDFAMVISETNAKETCGSVCCAMGWTPKVFPELVKWVKWVKDPWCGGLDLALTKPTPGEQDYITVAMEIFNISCDEAESLFTPQSNRPWALGTLPDDSTPQQVAQSIRGYVKWKRAQQ